MKDEEKYNDKFKGSFNFWEQFEFLKSRLQFPEDDEVITWYDLMKMVKD